MAGGPEGAWFGQGCGLGDWGAGNRGSGLTYMRSEVQVLSRPLEAAWFAGWVSHVAGGRVSVPLDSP